MLLLTVNVIVSIASVILMPLNPNHPCICHSVSSRTLNLTQSINQSCHMDRTRLAQVKRHLLTLN